MQSVGRPASLDYSKQFCGATYLLDRITSSLGVDKDLEACFGERALQIRSMAYYLILEDTAPLTRFKNDGVLHIVTLLEK